MTKTKKSNKGLALVLAAVLALTPMAGFPITALATGDTATPKAEAPAIDAGDAPATDAGETPQADAPATDADATTDATPSTPAPDAETPQAEAPATDAGTNPDTAGSATKAPAANVVTPDLTPTPAPLDSTPTVDPAAANDGVVNEKDFPDKNFWKYVQQDFDKNKNQTLEADEIEAAISISVPWSGITTLQGIEHFTALTSLDCVGNSLGTLNLTKNPALTDLSCGSNQLDTLNLTKNPALKSLQCSGSNKFTTLNLSENPNLTTLSCQSSQLTELDLTKNTALTGLNCSGSQLITLDLTKNTALTGLRCSGNQLTTLDLPATDTLTLLDCDNNKLTALNLTNSPAITWLNCHHNQLTTLDVSANADLINLYCYSNQLTSLDLTGKSLESFSEISPQAPQISVVKRGAQYELDLKTLAKGQTLTAITLDGAPVTDLATYEKMRDTAPTSLQYTCETGALSTKGQTMEVATAGFDLYHPATLVTDANGTLTCDVASPMANELVLLDGTTPTFTAAAASGYQIATLKVGKKDITVNEGATSQTLTLPPVTDAVSITATFKEIPAPPTPPVDPADPINPPTSPVVPDNGGNNNNGGNGNNNGGGTTTIVERTNTVTVPAAPQAAALAAPETPATAATAAAKTEAAPAKAAADNAAPQGQLENPALGAQGFDAQHSHLPLALLLLAVWLVGGFAVIRQRKHAHDAIEGTSY